MRISYHKDTDSLYLHLSSAPTAESEEVAPDTVLHFDDDGGVTGVEFYADASRKVDLSDIELRGIDSRRASNKRRRETAAMVGRSRLKRNAVAHAANTAQSRGPASGAGERSKVLLNRAIV